jgi:hypothetical protein
MFGGRHRAYLLFDHLTSDNPFYVPLGVKTSAPKDHRPPVWCQAAPAVRCTLNGRILVLFNSSYFLWGGTYRLPAALVLDRQERQTVDTLKITDVPCHECRAGEQRCRSHDAIGGLEMILPTERPCQLGQAGFQREDHHGREELLNLSHVLFRQPWMTQQFQFRHDRHKNGHILSQDRIQERDHRRVLIQVVDNGVRIQGVHERLTLRERRLVPFLPHLRHLMRVQFAVQLLLGGFPECEPVWSSDRTAGLHLGVVLRRNAHREASFHDGWMRL